MYLLYYSFSEQLLFWGFAQDPVLSPIRNSFQVLPLLAEIRLNDVNILITVLGEHLYLFSSFSVFFVSFLSF